MALHERTWRPYPGPLTASWSRVLVLPRYAFQQVFGSKIFTAFFALCFLPTVVAAILIYLHHNLAATTALQIPVESGLRRGGTREHEDIDRAFIGARVEAQTVDGLSAPLPQPLKKLHPSLA